MAPSAPGLVSAKPLTLTFDYGALRPGLEAVYAIEPHYHSPVGYIWYRHILLHTLDIQYIFVHEFFRRRGLARRLLNELWSNWPDNIICTACGNELSTPWLKAMGFKQGFQGWALRPPQLKNI